MLAVLPMEFWWLMLAFGLLIAVLIVAIIRANCRTPNRDAVPRPVRFVPHWHLMFLVAAAALSIVTAILIPLLTRFVQVWWGG